MLWFIRKHRQRNICTHRTDRFFAINRHRLDDRFNILAAVAKYLLVTKNRISRQAGKSKSRFSKVF